MNTNKVFIIIFASFFFQQFWLLSNPVPIKPYMVSVLFGLIYAFFIVREKRYFLPLHIPLVALFFFYTMLTFFWSNEMSLAFTRSVGIAFLIITYLVLSVLAPVGHMTVVDRKLLRWFTFFLTIVILYYLLGTYYIYSNGYVVGLKYEQGIFGVYMEGVLPRLRGFADSPNNMGLLIILLFYWVFLLKPKQVKSSFFYFLLGVTLLLTFSITSYLAFFIPLFLLGLITNKRMLIINFLIIFGTSLLLFIFYISNEWFANLIDLRLVRLYSGSGRFELFGFAVDGASNSPVFGHGISQARLFLSGFQNRELQSTHNSFIESFFEGGLLGLLLFITCWVGFIVYISKVNIASFDKYKLFSYLGALFIFSNSNLMIYVELMVLNMFFIVFLAQNLSAKNNNI